MATREPLVARAQELTAQGWTLEQIAAELGRARGTIHDYLYDPTREKAQARERRLRSGVRIRKTARWTNDQMIEAMQRWAKEYGQPPSHRRWKRADRPPGYPSANIVSRRFGSWNAALEAAGFETLPFPNRRVTPTEDLIEEIRQGSIWGAAPGIDKGRFATVATLLRERGISWPEACTMAGVRARSGRHA